MTQALILTILNVNIFKTEPHKLIQYSSKPKQYFNKKFMWIIEQWRARATKLVEIKYDTVPIYKKNCS